MKSKQIICTLLSTAITFTAIALPTTANAKTTVKAPTLHSVTQTDITTAKITWSKVTKAKGYTLYYSTNGRKYKKLTTTTKKSYVHKKLKNNKKYYYKVKSYRKIKGKKVYSKFSNIQTLKCKNDLLALYEPYRTNKCTLYINKFFTFSGNNYYYGFILNRSDSYAIFNLKGKYKQIEFTYGDVHINGEYATLEILSDDESVASFVVKPGDIAKTVRINIDNANKLEFKINGSTYLYLDLGIANIKLYK